MTLAHAVYSQTQQQIVADGETVVVFFDRRRSGRRGFRPKSGRWDRPKMQPCPRRDRLDDPRPLTGREGHSPGKPDEVAP